MRGLKMETGWKRCPTLQPQGVGFGNTFAGGDFVVEVAQFAALDEEIHSAATPVFLTNSLASGSNVPPPRSRCGRLARDKLCGTETAGLSSFGC